MKEKLKDLKKKNITAVALSVIASFLFVALITTAATTISTNIDTGGTLAVTGASTLTGAVWASSTLQATGATVLYNNLTVDTTTLHVDSSNNRVGIGSTTPSIELSVAGDGYLTGGLGLGERNAVDKTILLNGLTSDPTGTAGLIYYNSTNGNVRLYNGTAWGVIGTSTGLDLTGSKVLLADITKNFLTLGTTTANGASLATLEATSTATIPLTVVGRSGQTANLFQITANGGSLGGASNLFTVNAAGNATTSNVSVAGYLWVDGYATTTGGSGNIATQGTLTVNSTSVLTGTSTITTGTNIGGGYSAGGTGATINSLGRLEINGDLAINGLATTTSADGNIATAGTLTVNSTSVLTGTSTITTGTNIGGGYSAGGTGATINSLGRLEINDDFVVNGKATTTSGGNISTAGTLTIGTGGSAITDIVFGVCNFATVNITASSTGYVDCAGATGITTNHKSVFVSATSSLPENFIIQAASSSAATNINVRIFNRGGILAGGVASGEATGARGLNFIGIR